MTFFARGVSKVDKFSGNGCDDDLVRFPVPNAVPYTVQPNGVAEVVRRVALTADLGHEDEAGDEGMVAQNPKVGGAVEGIPSVGDEVFHDCSASSVWLLYTLVLYVSLVTGIVSHDQQG
ncbi:hypothetical protein CQZ93_25845 [Ochrobactrum vermis]|nr:hypothetical protein CQZ93_25845 [Ochrobactrum vermis]